MVSGKSGDDVVREEEHFLTSGSRYFVPFLELFDYKHPQIGQFHVQERRKIPRPMKISPKDCPMTDKEG